MKRRDLEIGLRGSQLGDRMSFPPLNEPRITTPPLLLQWETRVPYVKMFSYFPQFAAILIPTELPIAERLNFGK